MCIVCWVVCCWLCCLLFVVLFIFCCILYRLLCSLSCCLLCCLSFAVLFIVCCVVEQFIESMSDVVKQGIVQAGIDLLKENQDKLLHEVRSSSLPSSATCCDIFCHLFRAALAWYLGNWNCVSYRSVNIFQILLFIYLTVWS